MLKIKEYVKVQNLEEAYALYQKKSSVVLGGMLWLKMQNRTVGTAIDLSGLNLNSIEEKDTEFCIGAMTTLRTLETHPGLNALTQNAMAECLGPIVGVQFRNMATIGGSLCGKFGFSDPLTLFLALHAKVEFYHRGVISLAEFLELPAERDILVRVIIPKGNVRTIYLSQRNTATDFPVLTCALCQRDGDLVCALGGRPKRAQLYRDENGILNHGITAEYAETFARELSERVVFGSNSRGSAEYRKKLCQVLVRRGLLALQEGM